MNNIYRWPLTDAKRHPRADDSAASRPLYAPLRDLPACHGDACSSGDLPCPTPQHCRLVAPAPAEASTDVGAEHEAPKQKRPMPDGTELVVAVIAGLAVYGIGALAWLAWKA